MSSKRRVDVRHFLIDDASECVFGPADVIAEMVFIKRRDEERSKSDKPSCHKRPEYRLVLQDVPQFFRR